MLAKRIIPCLDVTGGRVVKGVRFVDLRDAGDPAEVAKVYSDEGADEIVFLDITATVESRETMRHVVEEVAGNVMIPLTVGGGIRTAGDFESMLHAGADKVGVNSAAVRRPEVLTEAAGVFGSQCVVVAIDAKRRPGRVASGSSCKIAHPNGALLQPETRFGLPQAGPLEAGCLAKATRRGGEGETRWAVHIDAGRTPTELDAVEWAREAEARGAGEILLTSMDRDGTKDGYDNELNSAVSDAVGIPVIASGGAGGPEHLAEAFTEGRADAALAASIFHYGEYTIRETKEFLAGRGIVVRL